MPEQWIDDVMGDEARPRAGFEDQLARDLHREWRGGRTPWRAVAWVAAAAVLVVGAVAVLTRDDDGRVVPADTTVPATVDSAAPSSTAPDTTSPTSTTMPSTTVDPSISIGVTLYLMALADGDYDTAAGLLNEGGLELEARADLRPLFRPEFGLVPGKTNRAALAAALEKWCARALCVQPTDIGDLPDGRWTKAVFPVGFAGDGTTVSLFSDYSYEGQAAVTGLPLQLPSFADRGDYTYDSIDCPVDQVTRVDWADVDGDGWVEQLVSQMIADSSDESGIATYRITVCGTMTEVEPLEVTGDGLVVYPVNATGEGPDTLLIGFAEGYPNGTIHRVENGRIVEISGTSWGFGPPVTGYEQNSLGCADLAGNGTVELVNYTFTESDGRLRYTATPALRGGASAYGDLDETSQEAGDIRVGLCNGLPVMLG